MNNFKNLDTYCNITNENVKIKYKNIFFAFDSKTKLPQASRYVAYDCERKNCPNYRFCKMQEFPHIKNL